MRINSFLTNQIAADLNISKFAEESVEEYGSRVIYSALTAWARVQVLGKSYTDITNEDEAVHADYYNVDIMHIQSRLAKLAYGLLTAIPFEGEWFKDVDMEVCSRAISSEIVERLRFCCELTTLNKRRVTISPTRSAQFLDNELMLGGVNWKGKIEKIYSVGIGRWLKKSSQSTNYNEVFNLPNYSAKEYYRELDKNASWMETLLNGEYKMFQLGTRGWYLNAWGEFNESKLPNGISILKNVDISGGYLIVKNEKDGIYSARLDKWYYEEQEIYRIMYSLNAYNETPAVFTAKEYSDHIVLHCNSLLPNAEMRILLMSSWPKRFYNDIYYRIIPRFIWGEIEEVLNKLGIIIDMNCF